MKVSPVSADLLIKLTLGAVALGVVVYVVRSGFKGLADLAGIPGQLIDKAVVAAKDGGATWQERTVARDPVAYQTTYADPLINNDGMDFGQLSG